MKYLFICYPKCSTCKAANKWLDENRVEYTYRHIEEECPTEEELRQWIEKSGYPIKKFFNTSGLVYKDMKLKDKLPTMTQEEQIKLLSSNGMLIKRPLLIGEDKVLIGFKKEEWEKM